ncbi:MAG: hypothetical protein PWQ38_27 [Proteiniphilum sp.]|jgi:hypothetical protein|nr:hypothetical protein [Proteiniphilum sp.]
MLLVTGGSLYAQKTIRVNAVRANDYGVVYTLPKSSFEITLLVKKSNYRRGDFYTYAKAYLGINDPITEDRTLYTLEDLAVVNRGIADKDQSYMIEFRDKTLEPYLTLREDGVILAVNSEGEIREGNDIELPASESVDLNPRRYFTQETLMAGSTAKQAELVARQILDLRRSRTDILTGEAESMPPDGTAYKVVMDQIDLQEKALTGLFTGTTAVEYLKVSYEVIPDTGNIDRRVVARFSKLLGPVDADNLAGEPIYFSLRNKTPRVEMNLSEREQKKLEEKLSSGLVYNIPGKADLTIEFRHETLLEKEVDVVQYGSKEVLAKRMFGNMKQPIKVIFYPELGAIKQIIQ